MAFLGGLPRGRGETDWPKRFSITSAKRQSPTTTPWVVTAPVMAALMPLPWML